MTSLSALRRVLAWAVEQGMSVRGQLSEAQLATLERAFAGREPWSFELYPALRVFAYALSRLNLPDLPAILSFGDALRALDELRASALAPWPTSTAVTEKTFAELGYAATSAAITLVREANKASWREHASSNRQFLLRAAEHATGKRAVIVGAGKLYDIPLRKLAERFEQLVLVDVDLAAMIESVTQVDLEPKLHARLSLIRADVTGINDVFLEQAHAALALPAEVEVYAALLRLLHAYNVWEPPRFSADLAGEPFDFACSSMVLSQLATPLTFYVQRRFVERFPASQRLQTLELQVALGQFTHRVQQAHVCSLLRSAPCIALSSDISDQYTALDAHGNLVEAPARLPLIGAPRLDALIPRQQARPVAAADWSWRHVVPTGNSPRGRTVQVTGVVAERS